MIWKIPTIQQIYNEYHRQTFFYMQGVYPRSIKNFDSLYQNKQNVQYLKRFQNMLSRNRASVDWKLYIKAIASVYKKRFQLKILGTFAGNKLYRDYIKCLFLDEQNEQIIYQNIINSLKFITTYLKENQITFREYLEFDKITFPLALKHIYAGTISIYFYACFSENKINDFCDYTQDIFMQYFQLSKAQFIDTYITQKRKYMLSYEKILNFIKKIEKVII